MSPRTAQMTLTSRGIRIGVATVPRQHIELPQDAKRLQAAMLSKPRGPDWYVGLACLAFWLAAIAIYFYWG